MVRFGPVNQCTPKSAPAPLRYDGRADLPGPSGTHAESWTLGQRNPGLTGPERGHDRIMHAEDPTLYTEKNPTEVDPVQQRAIDLGLQAYSLWMAVKFQFAMTERDIEKAESVEGYANDLLPFNDETPTEFADRYHRAVISQPNHQPNEMELSLLRQAVLHPDSIDMFQRLGRGDITVNAESPSTYLPDITGEIPGYGTTAGACAPREAFVVQYGFHRPMPNTTDPDNGTAYSFTDYRKVAEVMFGNNWQSIPVVHGRTVGDTIGAILEALHHYRCDFPNVFVKGLPPLRLGIFNPSALNLCRKIENVVREKFNGSLFGLYSLAAAGRSFSFVTRLQVFWEMIIEDGMLSNSLGLIPSMLAVTPSDFAREIEYDDGGLSTAEPSPRPTTRSSDVSSAGNVPEWREQGDHDEGEFLDNPTDLDWDEFQLHYDDLTDRGREIRLAKRQAQIREEYLQAEDAVESQTIPMHKDLAYGRFNYNLHHAANKEAQRNMKPLYPQADYAGCVLHFPKASDADGKRWLTEAAASFIGLDLEDELIETPGGLELKTAVIPQWALIAAQAHLFLDRLLTLVSSLFNRYEEIQGVYLIEQNKVALMRSLYYQDGASLPAWINYVMVLAGMRPHQNVVLRDTLEDKPAIVEAMGAWCNSAQGWCVLQELTRINDIVLTANTPFEGRSLVLGDSGQCSKSSKGSSPFTKWLTNVHERKIFTPKCQVSIICGQALTPKPMGDKEIKEKRKERMARMERDDPTIDWNKDRVRWNQAKAQVDREFPNDGSVKAVDENGEYVASGVYYANVITNEYEKTIEIILIK